MTLPSLGRRGEGWVVLQLVLMAAIVGAALLPPRWPGAAEQPLAVAGAVLALAGAIVVFLAARALGRALTALPEPRRGGTIVERGPYAVVRHPIYAGGLLFFAGFSLVATVPSLALTAALAVVWALKARIEEERLAERFPAYDGYRRRVGRRFVPGLY